MKHFLRFGSFQEQEIFNRFPLREFDAFIFNGNLVAHAGLGLAAFLFSRSGRRNYLIDPQTHAFQHDPELLMVERKRGDEKVRVLKSSVRKLAEQYGEPVASKVGIEALLPEDLEEDAVLTQFVGSVCNFQRTAVGKRVADKSVAKYLPSDPGDKVAPDYVTPPYFAMRAQTLGVWLPVNMRSVEAAAKLAEHSHPPLAAQIVVDRDILTSQSLTQSLIRGYQDLPVHTVLLWVDGLDENMAGTDVLGGLLRLVAGLSQAGKEVVNLYGGYFSMLLLKGFRGAKLSGISHSAGYGEEREIMPVGGGIPSAKFYLRSIHQRLRFADALRIFQRKGWLSSWASYKENVCSCGICEEVLSGNPESAFLRFGESSIATFARRGNIVRLEIPTQEARVLTALHYLYSKRFEFSDIKSRQAADLLSDLKSAGSDFRRILGLEGVQHLTVWADLLAD